MKNLLIIGCGATGSSLYYILKKIPNILNKYNVFLWDKAKGAGGRMSSKRYTTSNNSILTVDLGAQYFSLNNNEFSKFSNIYENLISMKLLTEFNESKIGNSPIYSSDTKHFVSPDGSNSIIKYFLKSQENVEFEKLVTGIKIRDGKCVVMCKSKEHYDEVPFDTVVLTCPVPQILNLNGISELLDKNVTSELAKVKYSSRFALGLFYNDRPDWISKMPIMQYISESTSDLLAFISIDTDKRQKDCKEVSICVHSRAYPFGKENIDRSVDDIKLELLLELKRLYPQMTESVHSVCHKWRYSQIYGSEGQTCGTLVVNKNPCVILGGDGLVGSSGLHSCLLSADSILGSLLEINGESK